MISGGAWIHSGLEVAAGTALVMAIRKKASSMGVASIIGYGALGGFLMLDAVLDAAATFAQLGQISSAAQAAVAAFCDCNHPRTRIFRDGRATAAHEQITLA
jgi:hypothetical protein